MKGEEKIEVDEEIWNVLPKAIYEYQIEAEGSTETEALMFTLNWLMSRILKLEQQMKPLAENFLEEAGEEE